MDLNSSTLLKRGVSSEKLDALGICQESPLFDKKGKCGFRKRRSYDEIRQVDDDLIERLKKDFADDEIVGLTALIASQNMSS